MLKVYFFSEKNNMSYKFFFHNADINKWDNITEITYGHIIQLKGTVSREKLFS